jgi:hypothetical protein
VHEAVRALSPHLAADRYLATEIAALQTAVLCGNIGDFSLSAIIGAA